MDFDALSLEALRTRACMKWQHYGPDVIPLWVADMDFPTAEPVMEALVARARSGNLGYPLGYGEGAGEPGLRAALVDWLEARHGWRVPEEAVWPLSGIIPGLYLAAKVCASEGEEVILQSPLYPPFMSAVNDTGRVPRYNPLEWGGAGWHMDFDHLESLVTPATRLLVLCNPHNPTGRVFRRDELERLAEFALRHRLWVLSDELHSDLVYEGHRHIPFASLSNEVAQRTVTLLGPTKTFNIAGLKIGFVVSQNGALKRRFQEAAVGLVSPPNVMAQSAARAAYEHGEAWLTALLRYLQGNRDLVTRFVREHLPGSAYAPPEGTYLAWLDLRGLGLGEGLYSRLLECKVGLNEGTHNGPGGEGFARLNFATSRPILEEALARLESGLLTRA